MKFFSKFIENVREKLIFFLPIFFFLPSLYLHFSPVEPVQRGFFCDDESLNYPFEEKETVPTLICLIIWMSIGVLLMLFKRKTFLKDFFMFVLGLSICTLSTDLCKFSVGSLRPYFLSICKPDLESICYGEDSFFLDKNDNETYPKEFYRKYVSEEVECENSDLIKEARLSFVSGHTSISFYSAVFLAYLMQKNVNKKVSLPFQLGIFILAFWISITRLTDYKHHVSDIFFGALLGTIIAWFIKYKQNIFEEKKVYKEGIEMNTPVEKRLTK